jgi:hypothetical protein
MAAAALTEPGVEDGQLPAHRLPALARAGGPPRLPDGQQVAHLEDGEDDELEEGGRGKRVEQRLDHNPGREVQQAQVRVHDGLLPNHQQRHFRGALQGDESQVGICVKRNGERAGTSGGTSQGSCEEFVGFLRGGVDGVVQAQQAWGGVRDGLLTDHQS